MLTRLLAFAVLVVALVVPLGCSTAPDPWGYVPPGKLRVVVSFPPLYSFVSSVAGDRAAVISLCTTTGPHDYAYSPNDAMILRKADILFAVGFALDDTFVDKGIRNSANAKLKDHIIKLGERLKQDVDAKEGDPRKQPAAMILYGECDHPEHQGKKHTHPDDIDPHMWTGIPQAKYMVGVIRDELKKIDPDGAEDYDKNAAEYLATLDKLQSDGRADLKDKTDRRLVTYHRSMAYFADTFLLNIADVIRKIPTDNPDAKEIADLVKKCKETGVRIIAVEPQYADNGPVQALLKALNKEAKEKEKVKVIVLDPLETAAPSSLAKDWYEKRMQSNLDTLKKELP
jgi:ABC-type Zn uptake system ZnuABC Zn-binding protein ZnuA